MKVCVIGAFGFDTMPTGGQPVKTRNLFWLLSKYYGTDEVSYVETYGWKKHPFKIMKDIRCAVKQSENVIMLPAHNGVKVFAPLLCKYAKGTSVKLFYDVIGGWLPQKTERNKKLAAVLRRFNGIWVETSSMKNTLERQGFSNVLVIPNFKFITPLTPEELPPVEKPYRLCTFSRVMKEKGIEDAIDAVIWVNHYSGNIVYTLDIYGPVDEKQIEWFDRLKKNFPKYIRYQGCVDSDKSVEVLKNYFALLFPTHFYTEGVPGTIIDAYAAGIPVISTKWENFEDVVENEKTGIGYEFEHEEQLREILLHVVKHSNIIMDMKKCCLNKMIEYAPERIIQIIIEKLALS